MSPDPTLGEVFARLEERIEGLRIAVHTQAEMQASASSKAEERIRDDIDSWRSDVQRRFDGIDQDVNALKLAQARAQGAAEERVNLGVPASPLPPPVATLPAAAAEKKWWQEWDKRLIALCVALAGLASAVGGLFH